ncbi:MAG: DUF6293 family protein [Methanospirillum sp.]
MREGIHRLVHIIPLGHEIDRAVRPFETAKADRVYLLSSVDRSRHDPRMFAEQKYYVESVRSALEARGIEVVVEDLDLFDLLAVIGRVSAIICREQSEGNLVYVNMSAAGRLTTVGTTLAAMTHDVRVYYVFADGYAQTDDETHAHGLSICMAPRVVMLENFRIALPPEPALGVLVHLCREARPVQASDLLDLLRRDGVPGYEEDYRRAGPGRRQRIHANYLTKLNNGVLARLRENGYILSERQGRRTLIAITESGRYVAHASGRL